MLTKYQMAAVSGSLEGTGSGRLANPQHRVCHPIGSMTEHPPSAEKPPAVHYEGKKRGLKWK